MAMNERYGRRDLLYSGWHRPSSISRFVGQRTAHDLSCIDVDYLEFCSGCRRPIAIIETQRSFGPPKSAAVCVALGGLAKLPVFTVSYAPNESGDDIQEFRWRQLWPRQSTVLNLTPSAYAFWLAGLHASHQCGQEV